MTKSWITSEKLPKFLLLKKKNVRVQCAVSLKDQCTQLGMENSTSYRKDTDQKITYRHLLTSIIFNKDSAVEFCFEMGLLSRTQPCQTCGNNMSLIKDSKAADRHRWYCRKKTGPKKHEHKLSFRTGTFFEKSNMTIKEILQILYLWVHGHSQKKTFNM